MSDNTNKQQLTETDKEPRVWVKSFGYKDPGRSLSRAQRIRGALRYLSADPSIGMACVMIPGKAPTDVSPSDDISIIGRQHGIIAIKTASIPEGALNVVLLVREKLRVLEAANAENPGLVTRVLGIQEQKFNEIAKKLRDCRNRLAHSDPDEVVVKGLDFTGVPEDCRRYAKLLVKWSISSC